MTTVIATIAILALIIALFFLRNYHVTHFQKNARVGQICVFYHDNDRMMGEITMVSAELVVIVNAYGTYARVREEIYPC